MISFKKIRPTNVLFFLFVFASIFHLDAFSRNWCDDESFTQSANFAYDSVVYNSADGSWTASSSQVVDIECDLDDPATLSFSSSVLDASGSPLTSLSAVGPGLHHPLTVSAVVEPGEDDTVADNEFTSISAPQIIISEIGGISGLIKFTFTISLD